MIEIIDGVNYFQEAQTVLVYSSKEHFSEDDLKPISVGKEKIAPWGPDNLLPQYLMKNVGRSEIMGSNIRFNRDVCFGLGPNIVRVFRDKRDKIVDTVEVDSGPEYDFFERNDIGMFVLSMLTDMIHFHNAFAELIPESGSKKVYSLLHKEAMFSRWGVMDSKGQINYHYYCSDWSDPDSQKIVKTYVLNEFNAQKELKIRSTKRERMIFPVYMPSPGRPYYSRPEWYSLFESGWYDHSVAIPELKKAILKNKLGVQFIIYVANEYFDDICLKEGIDKNDTKAYQDRINKEKQAFNEFLAGSDNASKSILALKQMVQTGNSAIDNKWIEIEPIKNDISGGEYIDDTESVANIICYAMGVHSSLIGATPGKSSGSLSGSDKREMFMMKQALLKPIVNRVMRPLQLIKRHNGWDRDIMIQIPEYLFTTLDQNKSGKTTTISQEV